MRISIKVHKRGKELLVAACDGDLIGKTFRDGKMRLHVSKDFYDGEPVDEEILVNRLEMATVANLVGKMTVEIAIRNGFVDSECVIVIDGIPHAQMARMI
ncbi:MAG: DUF424 family protein [Thermoplasmata archaeon]|nr:DUF424 family protein [Thermoplasmata archaeon]